MVYIGVYTDNNYDVREFDVHEIFISVPPPLNKTKCHNYIIVALLKIDISVQDSHPYI